MSATSERWKIFLSKIQAKGNEFFTSMREEALPMLKKNNGDPMPIGTALHAIDLQIVGLCRKIDDTWSGQVENAFNKEGASNDTIEKHRIHGEQIQFDLHRDFRLLQTEVNYQMAQYILSLAEAAKTNAPFNCSQCSAPLTIPQHIYTAEHITCMFCQTVNTYEPGTYQRLIGTFCAEHLSRWAALDLLKQEIAINRELIALRGGAMQKGKQQLQQAREAYSKKYIEELKKYKPDLNTERELKIALLHF